MFPACGTPGAQTLTCPLMGHYINKYVLDEWLPGRSWRHVEPPDGRRVGDAET